MQSENEYVLRQLNNLILIDIDSQRKLPLFYIDFLFRISSITKNEFYNHLAYRSLEEYLKRNNRIDYYLANIILKWDHLKMVNLSLVTFFKKHDEYLLKIDLKNISPASNISILIDYVIARQKMGEKVLDIDLLIRAFIEKNQSDIINDYSSISFLFKKDLLKRNDIELKNLDVQLVDCKSFLEFCVNVNKTLFKYDIEKWCHLLKGIAKKTIPYIHLVYLDYIKNIHNVYYNKPFCCELNFSFKKLNINNLDFFPRVLLANYLLMFELKGRPSFDLFV